LRESACFELLYAILALVVWSGEVLKKKKKKKKKKKQKKKKKEKKKSHTTRIFHPVAGARPLIRNGPNLAVLVSGRT
jgi:flagellar biosynthesis component FlhA